MESEKANNFEKIVNAAAASASARRPGVYVCALPSRHTSVSYDRKSQSHIDTDNTNHSAGPPFAGWSAKRRARRFIPLRPNELRVTNLRDVR